MGQSRYMTKTWPFVAALLLGPNAQAAGLLGQPIALQNTRFCAETTCQLAGRTPIAGNLWEFVYLTAPTPPTHAEVRLFTQRGRVISGTLNLTLPSTADNMAPQPFNRFTYTQPGTATRLSAGFAALLTGQHPSYALLEEWLAACTSGARLNYAGAKLSCNRLARSNSHTVSLHIGR